MLCLNKKPLHEPWSLSHNGQNYSVINVTFLDMKKSEKVTLITLIWALRLMSWFLVEASHNMEWTWACKQVSFYKKIVMASSYFQQVFRNVDNAWNLPDVNGTYIWMYTKIHKEQF